MAKAGTAQLTFELTWWAFTFVLAGLVLLPIYSTVPAFPYFVPNLIYVVVAVTLTRYLFLLDISWLRDRLYLQGAIVFVLIPLIFYMIQQFNAFIIYFDEQGPDILVKSLEPATAKIMDNYLHAEYRFFGVWAVVAAIITPFRIIWNVFKRYKAGVRS